MLRRSANFAALHVEVESGSDGEGSLSKGWAEQGGEGGKPAPRRSGRQNSRVSDEILPANHKRLSGGDELWNKINSSQKQSKAGRTAAGK